MALTTGQRDLLISRNFARLVLTVRQWDHSALSRIAAGSSTASLGSSGHVLLAVDQPSIAGDAGKVRLVGGGLSHQVLDRGDITNSVSETVVQFLRNCVFSILSMVPR